MKKQQDKETGAYKPTPIGGEDPYLICALRDQKQQRRHNKQ
jgi:hypothetical protein